MPISVCKDLNAGEDVRGMHALWSKPALINASRYLIDNTHALLAPTLSNEQTSNLLPLVDTDLRVEHSRLIERASGESRVKACPPIRKPMESFVDLVQNRIDPQWAEYGGKPRIGPSIFVLHTSNTGSRISSCRWLRKAWEPLVRLLWSETGSHLSDSKMVAFRFGW